MLRTLKYGSTKKLDIFDKRHINYEFLKCQNSKNKTMKTSTYKSNFEFIVCRNIYANT